MSENDLEKQAAGIVKASWLRLDIEGRFNTETAVNLQDQVVDDALGGITGVQHNVVKLRTLVRDQIRSRFGELWRQLGDT